MNENVKGISGNKIEFENKEIHYKVRVAPIDEKIREGELLAIWFGHVQKRAINAPIQKSELIQIEGSGKKRHVN